jgi:hypothetical protein
MYHDNKYCLLVTVIWTRAWSHDDGNIFSRITANAARMVRYKQHTIKTTRPNLSGYIHKVWRVLVGPLCPVNRELVGYLVGKCSTFFFVKLRFFMSCQHFAEQNSHVSQFKRVIHGEVSSIRSRYSFGWVRSAPFYGTRRFITMYTRSRQLLISRVSSI